MATLRLLSYNTWKNEGDYPARLDPVRRLFTGLDIDVYFLQEVFISNDRRLSTLGECFLPAQQLNLVYCPARDKQRHMGSIQVRGFSGLAIATPHRVLGHGIFSLPAHAADPHRCAQWCKLSVAAHELIVINTHLTHLPGQPTLRRHQFKRIKQFCQHQSKAPVIIAGDMNCSPEDLDSTGMIGCHRKPFPGTLIHGIDSPRNCLDHLYISSRSQYSYAWDGTQLLLEEVTDGFLCSDHKAVYSQLLID